MAANAAVIGQLQVVVPGDKERRDAEHQQQKAEKREQRRREKEQRRKEKCMGCFLFQYQLLNRHFY